MTYQDVVNFNEETLALLKEMGKSVGEFKVLAQRSQCNAHVLCQFDLNVDMMSSFMNLFVKYAQLNMLAALIPDPRVLLATYAKSYHQTSGNTEANFVG